MNPTYKGFEAKKSNSGMALPPKGAYVAEIKDANEIDIKINGVDRKAIEVLVDIIEGEYKDRYVEAWNDAKERYGDNVYYRGSFRLIPYVEGDEDWRKRSFEANLWCVQESNPGYKWDWDEKKLKGKKVGINLRNKLSNYMNNNGEVVETTTTEICKFETVDDVRNGKCRPQKDRDARRDLSPEPSTDGSNFTDVSKNVSVPW